MRFFETVLNKNSNRKKLTEATSGGVYSLYNGWLKQPSLDKIPDNVNINDEYIQWEDRANDCSTVEDIDNFIGDLYELRQRSLLDDGEYSEGNLVFKELRYNGIIQKLKDLKIELENQQMSLGENNA